MLSPFDDLRVHGHREIAERARLTKLVDRPPQVPAVSEEDMLVVPESQAQQAKVQLISPPRPPRRLKHPTPPLRAPPRPPPHTLLPAHSPPRALAFAPSSALRGLGVPRPRALPPPRTTSTRPSPRVALLALASAPVHPFPFPTALTSAPAPATPRPRPHPRHPSRAFGVALSRKAYRCPSVAPGPRNAFFT